MACTQMISLFKERNVVDLIINLPFGDVSYHLVLICSLVILGMVYHWFYHIRQIIVSLPGGIARAVPARVARSTTRSPAKFGENSSCM